MINMNTRKCWFILFCVALPTALALWAYFYTVSLPFRVVFLKQSIGPLLLWQIQSPLSSNSIILFTVLLISTFFSCIIFQRKKRSLIPFTSFWHLSLTPLLLSQLSAKFPEFIPLTFVLLPAASIAAFLVLIFWKQPEQINTSSVDTIERNYPNPEQSPESHLRSKSKPLYNLFIVWITTFFILLTSGLYVCEKAGYKGGDVKYYFTIASSIHHDHDIHLANNIRNYRPAPRYHISEHSQNGYAYSWHPVGLPLILAPIFNEVGADKVKNYDFKEALIIMCIIGAFLASQIYLAVLEETGNTSISLWVWIVLSFSSPLWFYSFRAWPFVPGALCALYTWRQMHNFHETRLYQIVILNLLLAWFLWLHDTFIVCYGILGIFLLYHWVRKLRDPKTLVTVAFQALNLGIFFWFHYRWFGKALFGQPGRLFAFWPGMLGSWFDYYRGMVFAAPIHLLCFILIFIYAFKKRNLSGFVLLALYLAGFVINTASWHWVDPFNHPGRRLVQIIPFTCIPLGYFLKKRKNFTFYWLVTFLSLLSVSYMLFFIVNPAGIDQPIHSLALSYQRFRSTCFHLPSFGRYFHNFPWTHVRAVSVSFASFILFWGFLLLKEGRGSIYRTRSNERHKCRSYNCLRMRFLFAGMWLTLLWIFVSVGWMKMHFDTPSPISWNTSTNCAGKRNIGSIGHPPLKRGLYRYLIHGFCLPAKGRDKTQEELSWSIEIKKKLPTSLDLTKGMYRFHVIGSGKPSSRATLTILDMRERKELSSSNLHVDVEGNFSHQVEINLSRITNRIKLELSSQWDEIAFKRMTITPIPAGLEPLISKIEEKGEPSGWVYLD